MFVVHLLTQLPLALWFGAIGAGVLLTQQTGLFVRFFLGLPGTLAHELAHFMVAFFLRANPRSLRLFPTRDEQGNYTLGSVLFEARSFSAGWVALAPLYVLPVLMGLLLHWARAQTYLIQVLCGYVLACLAVSALPSSADWRIARQYPLGTLLLLVLLAGMLSGYLAKG